MKVGIFSLGLDTYWDQFDQLLDHLNGYHREIRDRIASMEVEVVDAGMVDCPEKADGAATLFKQEDVEVIFLFFVLTDLLDLLHGIAVEDDGVRSLFEMVSRVFIDKLKTWNSFIGFGSLFVETASYWAEESRNGSVNRVMVHLILSVRAQGLHHILV